MNRIHEKKSHLRRRAGSMMIVFIAIGLLLAQGCSASSETTTGKAPSTSGVGGGQAGAGASQEPDFPPGKFTVQLGAYQSEEAARKVASVAESRFTRQLFTVYDAVDRLYKVMLGMFDTKDQARAFRDTIVRQYAGEYVDAWVSELTR
jgi:ABC-type cobalamin/Fe3+-siderophores transport system ATPase subunit